MGLMDLIRKYVTVKVNTRIDNGQAYMESVRENPEYNYLVDSLQRATRACANNLIQQYPNGDIKLETKMKVRIR